MTESPQPTPLQAGLMVIHGNRPESLCELLMHWTQQHPLGPLENEWVLVQSNGIAQWLKMAWAQPAAQGGVGVCAATQVSLPSLFLWRMYRAELGRAQVPEQSPLDKRALTWRLMRLLPAFVADGQSPNLQRFLGDDAQGRKRFQLAERLADLYDQYQVYRADWLTHWAAGRWYTTNLQGQQQPLPDDQVWQARLWQALLADVQHELGEPALASSRAGVHQRFLAHRQSGRGPVHAEDLPRRVIVFGISSLPAQALEALAALATTTQVLLCVHNPSMHMWSDARPERELWRSAYRRNPQLPAPDLARRVGEAGGHPLLSAWGKQGRDYVALIDRHDQEPERYRPAFERINGGRIDLFVPAPTDHLLGQLQDDVLHLRPLAESRALWPAVNPQTDHSLRFHRAHSPQREVEVLHDQLLARLGADPTLTPRDIVVMVPDVEVYAPHIAAVFGRIAPDSPRHIPHTVLDQSERTRHPMLLALERFMALPEDRLRASDVLDWLDVPAVQQRFGLSPEGVAQLKAWIEGAGVRWGLNAEHRRQLGFDDVGELNSWHFGLQRMLLGYATGNAGPWQGVLPYDEVAGLSATVLGPLARFIAQVQATARDWARPATPETWVTRLQTLLAQLFAPASDEERALMVQLGKLGDDWLAQTELAQFTGELPATVVREAWLGQLDAPQLGRRFLTGGVSFCSLMPMRAIPFRVVCLLGMNDGDYPRQSVPAAFDLMQRDYRPGDRSRREDDRYLFLEAMLSARDALYISWVGRSIRDNSEAAPSTLVGQLRDHVAAGWRLDEAVSGNCRRETGGELTILPVLTTNHPLQPFSPLYFDPAAQMGQLAQVGQVARAGQDAQNEESVNSAPHVPYVPHALSVKEGQDDEADGDDFASALDDDWDRDTDRDSGDDLAHAARLTPSAATAARADAGATGAVRASPSAPLPFDPASLPPVYTFASEWAPTAATAATAATSATPATAASSAMAKATTAALADWVAPGAVQAPLPPLAPLAPLSPASTSTAAAPQGEALRVDLGQLARFLRRPIAAFYQQRLQVHAADAADAVPDDEAFVLDGLGQWGLQNALIGPLQHAINAQGAPDETPLTAAEPEALLGQLLARQRLAGQLPLHGFGDVAQAQLHKAMSRLMARYSQVAQAWPQALAQGANLAWRTPDGRLLMQASLQGLRRAPDGSLAQVQLSASRLHSGSGLKHPLLLAPWVQHLAWHIALGQGGQRWPGAEANAGTHTGTNAGIAGAGANTGAGTGAPGIRTLIVSESGVWQLAPLAWADARHAWDELLAAWQAGLCAPLPLATGAGFAWLLKRRASLADGQDEPRASLSATDLPSREALAAARTAFEGGFTHGGDLGDSPAVARAYPAFDDLLREPGAFAHWAKRLYLPVLNGGHAWQPGPASGADAALNKPLTAPLNAPLNTPLRLTALPMNHPGTARAGEHDNDADDMDWGRDDWDAPDEGDPRL